MTANLLQAHARMEGFYISGSRPQRNNSPLDLIYGDEAVRFGSTGADGRYAKFATAVDGYEAGRKWLLVPAHFSAESPGDGRPKGPSGYLAGGYCGATFQQYIWRFAPPSDGNDASAYLNFVCTSTGHLPTDILVPELLVLPTP